MKIVRKTNSSPGSQLPGESKPEQSKTLIETTTTTTDHLQSETILKSESTHDNENYNTHEDPVLSPFPISFILPSDTFIPPVRIRFNTVDPLASSSEATEQLRALIQDRLRKRFGGYTGSVQDNNNNNNNSLGPILDLDIEIPFGFPLVPAEDNDHIWIRSKNEKLLPTYSNTDDSSSDDYDADDETTDEEDSDDSSSQMTTSDDDELEFDKL